MQRKESFDVLLEAYDTALKKYGLSYSARLNMVSRASIIIRRHESQGKSTLDGNIIADYFNEINERYCNGEIGKKYWQTMRREVERLLHFAKTREVTLANPQIGSRYTLLPEFQQIADDFLSNEAFHPNTRNDARWVTHKYFAWLAERGHCNLQDVEAEQLQAFMLSCAQTLAMSSVHNIKLYLSKLYAYLYAQGLSESSYKSLLSFTVKRGTIIQPVLTKEELTALLNTIDCSTTQGKRAYAIMLLGAVLGLRACDVVTLELSDIDWVNGTIKILQSKTAETVVLPLTEELGTALQDYILNGRPKVSSNRIFIRLLAPFRPLSTAVTIGDIYHDCCKAAGLPVSKRFHTLRRTLGTSMVTTGTPVTTVAQVLGHAEIDSTKKYISLDSRHLKLCALPFDGIVPDGGGVG